MKKITTLCSLLFLSIAIFSKAGEIEFENSKSYKNNDKATNKVVLEKALTPNTSAQSGFWSDDFSIPTNWTTTVPSGSGIGSNWVIGTIGPSGSSAITKINSSTQANG